jgi:hypothetical protein
MRSPAALPRRFRCAPIPHPSRGLRCPSSWFSPATATAADQLAAESGDTLCRRLNLRRSGAGGDRDDRRARARPAAASGAESARARESLPPARSGGCGQCHAHARSACPIDRFHPQVSSGSSLHRCPCRSVHCSPPRWALGIRSAGPLGSSDHTTESDARPPASNTGKQTVILSANSVFESPRKLDDRSSQTTRGLCRTGGAHPLQRPSDATDALADPLRRHAGK